MQLKSPERPHGSCRFQTVKTVHGEGVLDEPREAKPAILIVDDDLGFLVWLGQSLAASGYITIPASNGAEAMKMIGELQIRINLAVVNFALANIDDLVRTLKCKDPSVKVIAIEGSLIGPVSTADVDAIHPRSQAGWPAIVQRVLKGGGAWSAR